MEVPQEVSQLAAALAAALPPESTRTVYSTVEQFSQRNPAFTVPALRNLIFKAGSRQSSRGAIPGNGLVETGAVIRLGRRVLINDAKFLAWVASQAGAKQ